MGYSLSKSMREVHAAVLKRAKGKCEMCKVKQGTERVSTVHKKYLYNVKLSVVRVGKDKQEHLMALCEICRAKKNNRLNSISKQAKEQDP